VSDIDLGPAIGAVLALIALSVLFAALALLLLRRAVIAPRARLPAALTLAAGLGALAAAWSDHPAPALVIAALALPAWVWLGRRVGLRAWATDTALALLTATAICAAALAWVVS
jgi:hypothetical protein